MLWFKPSRQLSITQPLAHFPLLNWMGERELQGQKLEKVG